MIVIPVSSPSVKRSSAYCTILGLLNEVEFANIQEESAGVITVRMLTASKVFIFDVVREATSDLDRVSVLMPEGESQLHYGYKLLEGIIAAFAQKNIELTLSNDVKIFLNLYENLKGDNPAMNEDYRSIFPGLTFWTGKKLGMLHLDEKLKDTWRFA